jgi:uncharacterized membrane protein YagU involved in acid resistance
MVWIRLFIGAAAGLAATAPMTLLMLAICRSLPKTERYALPPEEIVDSLAEKAHLHEWMTPGRRRAVTLLSHFGYGAAAGMLYSALTRPGAKQPAARGVLYGLAVWATSYLGWLPAMDVLKPATEHPPRRSAMMISSHLLWGAYMGLLTNYWERCASYDSNK